MSRNIGIMHLRPIIGRTPRKCKIQINDSMNKKNSGASETLIGKFWCNKV